MKKILLISLLFMSFLAEAQVPPFQAPVTYGYKLTNLLVDGGLMGLPRDTFPVMASLKPFGWAARKGDSLYLWSQPLNMWVLAGGSGGGGGSQTENFNWRFDSSPSSGDPGSGDFRLNNVLYPSVTEIYVSDLCDLTGLDISNLFNTMSGDYLIYIQQTDDASKFIQFNASTPFTDNTGWFTIPVTFVQQGSGTPFGNNKRCTWYIINKSPVTGDYILNNGTVNKQTASTYYDTARFHRVMITPDDSSALDWFSDNYTGLWASYVGKRLNIRDLDTVNVANDWWPYSFNTNALVKRVTRLTPGFPSLYRYNLMVNQVYQASNGEQEISSLGGDLGAALGVHLNILNKPGNLGRQVVYGGGPMFDAVPATVSIIGSGAIDGDVGSTRRLAGYWAGYTSYLHISGGDSIDNFIAFRSGGYNPGAKIATHTGIAIPIDDDATRTALSWGVYSPDVTGGNSYNLFGGHVGIGTTGFGSHTSPTFKSSGMLQINSTTRGFITSRMTAAERLAITADTALFVWDSDSLRYMGYKPGTGWKGIAWTGEASGGGSSGWALGGNTIGSEQKLGSLDNFGVSLISNNVQLIGVGTSAGLGGRRTVSFGNNGDNDPNPNNSTISFYDNFTYDGSVINQDLVAMTMFQGVTKTVGGTGSIFGFTPEIRFNAATSTGVSGFYGAQVIRTSLFTESGSTGTINKGYSIIATAHLEGMDIDSMTKVYVENSYRPAGGTVANNFGLYIQPQTGATTNNYNIYSDGTTTTGGNYFGGYIRGNSGIFSSRTGNNSFALNSTGSYYGVLQNDAADTWSLGFASDLHTIGSSILKWKPSGTNVLITTQNTTDIGLEVKSITSQSANLLNISSSAGTGDLVRLTSTGRLIFGGASDNSYQIQTTAGVYVGSGSVAVNSGFNGTYFIGYGAGGGGNYTAMSDVAGAQRISTSGNMQLYASSGNPIYMLPGGGQNIASFDPAGLRVGSLSTPSAKLHIDAGSTAAGSAPIKIVAGTAMTTPEDGAMEYHSSHLYFTIGSTRYQLDQEWGKQGADVASAAGAITLGADGNSFEITGTSAITLISNLIWQNGSVVTLAFTSTATLTDGTANSGTNIGMELAGNTNFVASAGATVTLRLMEIGGTQRWREIARSVN